MEPDRWSTTADTELPPGDELGPCDTCGKLCDHTWGPECDDCDDEES